MLQMYLMYYMNEKGERVYTLKVRGRGQAANGSPAAPLDASERSDCSNAAASCPPCSLAASAHNLTCPLTLLRPLLRLTVPQKVAPDGTPTQSAHPARFSPDDKFSRERTTCKKRFGLLLTQLPAHNY